MRVLIVDDEGPSRARLRQMLGAHADVEVVGEAESGPQAMELVAALRPEVLLLDIQMPGCTGIDVAACLPQPRPRVIFCTAFDQHAVDAFELHAVDYLLKPISRVRLAEALDRVRVGAAAAGTGEVDKAVRANPAQRPGRFLVRSGDHYVVVGEARVLYFWSEEGLTKLVAAASEAGTPGHPHQQYWMDPTLTELEGRLDGRRFFRISRAALINLGAVAEVHPMPGGSGEVVLRNGARLEVSRRRFRELLEALG